MDACFDQLILFAHNGFSATGGIPPLRHDDVEAARRVFGKSVSEFLNHFARRVAHQYFAGKLSFEVADCAMNSLQSYCLSQYDATLPRYANEVYTAFDQGEHVHAGDAADTDSEAKYTRPQIQDIVTRDRILGTTEGQMPP